MYRKAPGHSGLPPFSARRGSPQKKTFPRKGEGSNFLFPRRSHDAGEQHVFWLTHFRFLAAHRAGDSHRRKHCLGSQRRDRIRFSRISVCCSRETSGKEQWRLNSFRNPMQEKKPAILIMADLG
jgi:hypothetical protein